MMLFSATQVLTASGRMLDFAKPDKSRIELSDIATGLSCAIRWRGALGPLTVAQHSVVCSCHIALEGSLPAQRFALLHDAAEAYMGDVPRPAKSACLATGIVDVEDRLLREILTKFGTLPDSNTMELVHHVDQDVLRWEVDTFRPASWRGVDTEAIFGAPSARGRDLFKSFVDLNSILSIKAARDVWMWRAQEIGIFP